MKIKKIFLLCLIFTVLLSGLNFCMAINPDNFKPVIEDGDAGDAIGLAQKIIGTINIVGTVISIVTVMVLGIKYMAGSVEQRAEYKKTMWPILIGIILLFGTSWIISLIYNIVPTDIS